jgi:uncharacterized 2Fe-2S/4Fe-4S cluster protein (DUF4445 family)
MSEKLKIRFEPDGVETAARRGDNLLEKAIDAGIRLTASCGGQGTCGTCKVIIKSGEVDSQRTKMISDSDFAQGWRQACQSRILTSLVVEIPVQSRLEKAIAAREARTSGVVATNWKFNPVLSKLYVELPPPSLTDNTSDLSRLLRGIEAGHGIKNPHVDFKLTRKLSSTLREASWKVTVTTLDAGGNEPEHRPGIINIEPGDTRARLYSLALDIGTTTVCGELLDLNCGAVVASAIRYNAQMAYGGDVISRINYSQKPGGLKKLQKAVTSSINEVINDLREQSKVKLKDISHIMAAGNPTMTQLLLGLDPQYLRLSPYTPTASFFPLVPAKSLGIKAGGHVNLMVFPSVASWVGGDIVSGIVGAGVHQRQELTFFLDIGTNGEIVIGNSEWMTTASCSAGPAFEGGGIRHGMVAMPGAIEDFTIDSTTYEPKIGVIGHKKPKGICGSGLINTVAGLLEAGLIAQNGKFRHDLPTSRIRFGSDGYEYVLAWAPETQIDKDIVLTEVDIDNLVRSKAAMYAGCRTLCKSIGSCTFDKVIIAGAFGSHLSIDRAITIGLLPDLPRERFAFIGNGSLLGARLTSFSRELLEDSRRIARMMTNVELTENSDFMDNYVAGLFLPHTHAEEFPSISLKYGKKEGLS